MNNQYKLTLNSSSVTQYQFNKTGDLGNFYSPLQNLGDKKGLGDFTTDKLKFDPKHPVEMEIVDEYDGSQNIIINDDINQPKLINTRMSVQENNTFLIPEHMGNAVNNVYSESELEVTTNLLKLYQNIPALIFNGLLDGGTFKCGSYIFYFKLADADGNLTNVVQESGIVQVHVGQVNTNKVRMGLEDEDAGKNISFSLDGIDPGFDYIRVFYERVSSGQAQAKGISYWMINQNYPINNGNCEILLTGNEDQLEITKDNLQTEFADIQSAKTSAINSNILFLGNISAYPQHFQDLQRLAWAITPEYVVEESKIGNLTKSHSFVKNGCYYNTKNVYNFTSYWPEEYYRFGINFIYDNNLVSQTFNIQGADLSLIGNNNWESIFQNNGDFWENDPDDHIFKDEYMTNSKGVVKFPAKTLINYSYEQFEPKVMGISFNLSHVVDCWKKIKNKTNSDYTLEDILKFYHIKGFFFTRQKRIPTILAQGIVVGLTKKDYGCIPVIQNSNDEYITKSFLGSDRLLHSEGSTITVDAKNVENKAIFIPDAELQEATYNQIFNGQEFAIGKLASTKSVDFNDQTYTISTKNVNNITYKKSKITAVQKGVKILTDGDNYFSSLAGDASDPIKTSDVKYIWNKTKPQDLTCSTSLIRGEWGYYAGISNGDFQYGDIVNIKEKGFVDNQTEQNLLEFQKRFNDYSTYSSISERFNISEANKESITCFRGDCFPSLFTHKVMNNFADPEMPTNTKIVDPACWCNNYAVRCTAMLLDSTHSNLTDDHSGWYVEADPDYSKNETAIKIVVGILTAGIGVTGTAKDNSVTEQTQFANEVAQAFETKNNQKDDEKGENSPQPDEKYNLKQLVKNGWIRKVNPQEQENNSGVNLKAIFKATSSKWELHGIASINRADVNAVSFAQWITFPVCSSMNLAFRDLDFSQATEEATFNRKRAFYPWEEMNIENHLVESNTINHGAKNSISTIGKPAFQQIPFIKQEFFNRIYWSRPNVTQQFINSYRMIYDQQFHEYNKEWGAITKLMSLNNILLVVFQHGVGLLPINTTPQSTEELSPYLAFTSILPTSITELSNSIGSMWKDSVIQSEITKRVYGVDTVARKIWVTDGQSIQTISDLKVNKFLNDFIDLSEFDFNEYLGHINVKTHYNAFKKDVIFTFYKDIPTWELTDEIKSFIKEDLGTFKEDIDLILKGTKIIANNKIYMIKKGAIYNQYNDFICFIQPKSWKQGTTWSLCYNEQTQTFQTFYDWYPVQSVNIDNIFFSFDKDVIETVLDNTNVIYKDSVLSGEKKGNFTISFTSGNYLSKWNNINKNLIDSSFSNKVKEFYIQCLDLDSNPFTWTRSFTNSVLSFYLKGEYKIESLNVKEIDISLDSGYTCLIFIPIDIFQKSEIKIISKSSDLIISDIHEININDLISSGIVKKDNKGIKILNTDLNYYFLRDSSNQTMKLWKHGYAGLYDNQGKIKPTNWYGKQHEFNFEFIVNNVPTSQKIFTNLQLLSNKAEPGKFEYEIVGEGYEWFDYKPIVLWANKKVNEGKFSNLDEAYKYILNKDSATIQIEYSDFPDFYKEGNYNNLNTRIIKKLPYLKLQLTDMKGKPERPTYKWNNGIDAWEILRENVNDLKDFDYSFNTSETCLKEDEQLNEQRVHTEVLANNMKKYGRVRGNMQYLEDSWKTEIRPISFEWAYLDNGELKKKRVETKHRDKYLKVKIRYSGEELAIIVAIYTIFDISYA